ncbi:esterase/lipase family protein [Candidatus Protochlamydia phocaeensis]|uniref:esterase/lipase family protein n=1 Tax=Candidatus Protochlamydia phocaeensis TaxID=1414722 RepID=UPI000837E325|nr:alpha/beta fold hydrolase [Candidatus Protochlamydia phocaeensis]
MTPFLNAYLNPQTTSLTIENPPSFRSFASTAEAMVQFTVQQVWRSLTSPEPRPLKAIKITLGIPFYCALTAMSVMIVASTALAHFLFLPVMLRKASFALYLQSSLLELLALFPLILTNAMQRPQPSPNSLSSSSPPILFVHGYLHNGTGGLFHAAQLERKAREEGLPLGAFYSIDLPTPFHSIETHAQQVKEKVEDIIRATGQAPILIGHSMGGLVCLKCAESCADEQIKAIITLASPLKGTPLASVGIGKDAEEMRLNSSFVHALQQNDSDAIKARSYHMGSLTDLIVPDFSALPDYSTHFQSLFAYGHTTFLYSQKVNSQIWKIYKNYLPCHPSA